MTRLLAISFALIALAGCGGRGRGVGPQPRNPAIARPLEVYQDLGMLAGPVEFPAVARFSTLAGPGDSTYVLLGMSMPNSALRFLREENAFAGEYRVNAVVMRDAVTITALEKHETVRVASFAETSRVEESIIFQDVIALVPGRYILTLEVADQNSSRGMRVLDTLDVPAYPRDAKLAAPLLVYTAGGRNDLGSRPDLIINPRNTIPYGADTPRVYLELYGAKQPQPISLRALDDEGAVLWSGFASFGEGTAELRHAIVELPAAVLPIGRNWLEAYETADADPQRLPLLVTISDQWMVANFDDVLRFLRYIAHPAELDSLRKGTGPERREAWARFWQKRDPLTATPINEFREQFFERVKIATDEFSEGGRAGWETDRGQVFIVLGPPDAQMERQVGRDAGAQSNLIEWLYDATPGGRLVLQFFDRTGFGRYELTHSSEAAFRTVAARMRPKS
ncbi:MAG: GWxTD domain-containing protein [Gemmatimonadota bacterium]